MYATNEWDKLKTVIVGSASGAQVPHVDISLRTVNYADVKNYNDIKVGHYPQVVIDEANEDLEQFANFLKGEGVKVLRPKQTRPPLYYDYCPRDLVFLHADVAIAAPMSIQARHENYRNIEMHIPELKIAPRCKMPTLYNMDCVGDPDILALTEIAPSFDAANAIRANDQILYLVSNSGNHAGAQYLQEQLGNTAKVNKLEGVYSYMHIDSTIAFLREGLMLINPSRIKDIDVLPAPFCDWDYIICPEPTDIGYYGDYNNASTWINMNLFSVNENLVVLEQHQHNLRIELEKSGIECAMMPMRHQRTLGGGFHCVTLDLERG